MGYGGDPVQLVLSRLEGSGRGVVGAGHGRWKARCPAHEDGRPSLAITRGDDGRVLLFCHAGCSLAAIVEALGLPTSALFPDDDARGRRIERRPEPDRDGLGRAVRSWSYRRDDGEEIFRVVRFESAEGKTYRPMRLRPDGGWEPRGLDGPRPLYRLPELRAADASRRVWVAEGEKCADLLAGLGLTATTSSGGARSARRSDWSPMAGRRVAIVPDHDDPGRRYAYEVAELLLALPDPAAEVRIVPLPGLAPGDDLEQYLADVELVPDHWEPERIADHLESLACERGMPPADFARLESANHAPFPPSSSIPHSAIPIPQSPEIPHSAIPIPQSTEGTRLIRAATVQPEAIRWLWRGRVARGKVTMLCGDPGLGKSFLTIDLAARVSRGDGWPDAPDDRRAPGRVLLLSAEDGLADTLRPRLDAAGADCERVFFLTTEPMPDGSLRPFGLKYDLPKLAAHLEALGDCRLVVIDPVTAYLGETDDHKNGAVRGLLAPLADLAGRHDAAVVLVSHLNKSSGGKAIYRSMGSLAFMAAARTGFLVARDRDDPSRRLLLPVKNNLANECRGLAYRIESGRVSWEPGELDLSADEALAGEESPTADAPQVDECAAWLRQSLSDGPMRFEQVMEGARALGFSEHVVKNSKSRAGAVSRRIGFGPGSHYLWMLRETSPF